MKVWTKEELELLREEGAEIDVETPKRDVVIQGLELVVAELKAISEASQQIAQKRHDDLVEAVNRLAMSHGPDIDLTPLVEAMKEPEKVSYRHEVERNNRGFISEIRSIPVKGDLH